MPFIIREVTTTEHDTTTRFYGPYTIEEEAQWSADDREFGGVTATVECYVEELREPV